MLYENLQAYLEHRKYQAKHYPLRTPDELLELIKKSTEPAIADLNAMLEKDGGEPLKKLNSDTYASDIKVHGEPATIFISLNSYSPTSRPIQFRISSNVLSTKQSNAYGSVKSIERELHNMITKFNDDYALQLKANQEKAETKSRQASTVILAVDGYDKSIKLTSDEFVEFGYDNHSYMIELLTMTTPEIIDRAIKFLEDKHAN